MNGPTTTRRTAVLAGAAGLAAVGLAGCGTEDGGSGDGGGEELAPTSDIPVGGGKILSDHQLVVTQPAEGEFVAFSAICTHQGCAVSQVDEDGILCTCHGSRFALEDGAVLEGPATEPLPEEPITVEGESILRG
ncbi:Rieske (2Fe-2S) protein [Streptomyces triticirhizae]|uniref:Cytochrome bc1 complex Rieske iron-sulfur subunit n=1 Tax=Streptomyces triticirhizae TaxID=2483353 RepID=A0A3M2LUR9_9ACTN|nr:Rieske (2Fe-2S) protein [Streptomyces triticirhizae]RMI41224.1 Rieske (2Fe-2S) protein [Streptomyces triticirhizae]